VDWNLADIVVMTSESEAMPLVYLGADRPCPPGGGPAIIGDAKGGDPMPNITVQWYAGRTDQQKREITAAITEAMVRIGKTTADQVHIVLQDIRKSDWGVDGKLASD
jgi:4-oxalocrotonate tautomerase